MIRYATAVAALFSLGALAQPRPEFEVVSTKRVEGAESVYRRASFANDETGLVIILKRTSAAGSIVVYGNDYVLAWESEKSIPRSPCMGISYAMKSPDEETRWSSIGGISRYWYNAGEQYFALLFAVPKDVHTFSLNRAAPFAHVSARPLAQVPAAP